MAWVRRYHNGMAPVLQVLLADADAATRNALALFLKSKLGLHAIGEAADGETLTRSMAENQPRLVLLDWSLPDRPAPERLMELKRANPDLRLVILSVDAAAAAEAIAIGAVFIHKGSAAEQVLEQLRGQWALIRPGGDVPSCGSGQRNDKDCVPGG